MVELVERYVFALAHLAFGLLHENAFFRCQDVVGIGGSLRFDKHAVLFFGERHQVPGAQFEGVEDLARDHDLAPFAHATDPLFGYGCFHDE